MTFVLLRQNIANIVYKHDKNSFYLLYRNQKQLNLGFGTTWTSNTESCYQKKTG